MLFSPNLPTVSPNNEQHNLENKDLENDGLEGQLHFKHIQSIVYKTLYNVVNSNDFDVSTQCITYVMGILSLLVMSMEPMNTLSLRQVIITFNNGCNATLSQP
jgi:hypothetical protein